MGMPTRLIEEDRNRLNRSIGLGFLIDFISNGKTRVINEAVTSAYAGWGIGTSEEEVSCLTTGELVSGGAIHVIPVTDVRGRVISWSSAGTCGFKGTRRGTPFAAQTAAGTAIRTVVDQGMQRAEVMIKGPGLGRDAALRAIRRSGRLFCYICDPMPAVGPLKKDVCKKNH